MHFRIFKGKQSRPWLEKSAEFRLTGFREYPYLYYPNADTKPQDVDRACYYNSLHTLLILAYEAEQIVGLAIGLPLIDFRREKENLSARNEFNKLDAPIDSYYYIGELSIVPEYQHQGAGSKLLAQIEKEIKNLQTYEYFSLISIEREKAHPLKSGSFSYRELWVKHNYVKTNNVTMITWSELQPNGSIEKRDHTLRLWQKKIS